MTKADEKWAERIRQWKGRRAIARGPNFEREVAELVQSLVATVTSAPPE
ncbi:MAG TPA: hypothetical protein VIK01_02035 [Polyangiaceae bacterium]